MEKFTSLVGWLKGKKTYGVAAFGLFFLAGVGLEWWPFSLAVLSAVGVTGLITMRAGLKEEVKRVIDSLCLALLVAVLAGCAPLQPGADPLVVRVEQAQVGARDTFDLVLQVDQANRNFWRTNAPRYHEFAEWLRQPIVYASPEFGVTNVPRVVMIQFQLDDVKNAYLSGQVTSNGLFRALMTFQEALKQAQAWEGVLVSTPTPAPK